MKTWKRNLIALSALVAIGSSASVANAADRSTPTRGDDQPSSEFAPAPNLGVDPPYDPGRGPGDLKAQPGPLTGPDDFTGRPTPPPPPPPFDPKAHVGHIGNGCIGAKMVDYSYDEGKWLPSSGW